MERNEFFFLCFCFFSANFSENALLWRTPFKPIFYNCVSWEYFNCSKWNAMNSSSYASAKEVSYPTVGLHWAKNVLASACSDDRFALDPVRCVLHTNSISDNLSKFLMKVFVKCVNSRYKEFLTNFLRRSILKFHCKTQQMFLIFVHIFAYKLTILTKAGGNFQKSRTLPSESKAESVKFSFSTWLQNVKAIKQCTPFNLKKFRETNFTWLRRK